MLLREIKFTRLSDFMLHNSFNNQTNVDHIILIRRFDPFFSLINFTMSMEKAFRWLTIIHRINSNDNLLIIATTIFLVFESFSDRLLKQRTAMKD